MKFKYTIHCFQVNVLERFKEGRLFTLCGKPYGKETIALFPSMFMERGVEEDEVCEVCRDHEDLPLMLLGELP